MRLGVLQVFRDLELRARHLRNELNFGRVGLCTLWGHVEKISGHLMAKAEVVFL